MRNREYPLYEYPKIVSFRNLLETRAAENPDGVCFRYLQGHKTVVEVTYRTFYEDVRALATYLLKHHVRGGRKIAILGENSYRWLVAYFAIVTSGNIAVLIAKDAADSEVSTLLFQSHADFVLYSPACARAANYCKKQQYGRRKTFNSMDDMDKWIDKGRRALEKGSTHYDQLKVDPDEMCTIFFTSGSTGFSKGVMLSQTNLCTDADNCLMHFSPIGPTLTVLPFTHAFGLVVSMIIPFHTNIENFICSKLASFMREMPIAKPRTLVLVPLFVETFSKTIWRTAKKEGQEKVLRRGMKASDAMLKVGIDRRKQLFGALLNKFGGQLDTIVCGGAPLDPRYVKEFRSFGIEIVNGYGITECSPVLAVNRVYHHVDGSVGRPLPDVDLRIDDADDNGVGEIVVRGPNVMRGYYNDEQSTQQVMDADGWFHTGDLGYQDKNGFLFVTGRKKSLIILANGENVSPEELEQYVERIEEVNEVVVYEKDNAITAEVYPEESDLTKDELFKVIQKKVDKLNASLPNYKHIQKLKLRATEFEKTASRKIKRYRAGKGSAQAETPSESSDTNP